MRRGGGVRCGLALREAHRLSVRLHATKREAMHSAPSLESCDRMAALTASKRSNAAFFLDRAGLRFVFLVSYTR